MHTYGVRDVERLLRVPRATVRALVDAGFVVPTRGPRNSWRFSFQDLIVLRTAQALADAQVPRRRITRSVRELRRHLPAAMPLSGLSIGAVADRVVVREGGSRWQADSGQYLLEFEGDPGDGSFKVVARAPAPPAPPVPPDAFAHGLALEGHDAEGAMRAYRRALAAAPGHRDAGINLGRLLHEARRLAEAEAVYAEALHAGGPDAVLFYNLALVLEDLDRAAEALQAYRAALDLDPGLADGHYNLALLCGRLGRPKEALRHMSQYRRLTESRSG